MIVTSIATLVSTIAYILTALYIRAELKAVEKDRFLNVTSELFTIWQDPDFMNAQMWLIHKMSVKDWQSFIDEHRGDYGETAFHRVGSYYDRIGTLVRLKLIDSDEILSTVGGYAIAVWQRIEPLVYEARKIENSALFNDFEAILPACYECYVPSLGDMPKVTPFSGEESLRTITIKELKKQIDAGKAPYLLDVRKPHHVEDEKRTIPGSIAFPPERLHDLYTELPKDREIIVFCACPHDETSTAVAKFLAKKGYKPVVLAGGHTEWLEAGYPMELPKATIGGEERERSSQERVILPMADGENRSAAVNVKQRP